MLKELNSECSARQLKRVTGVERFDYKTKIVPKTSSNDLIYSSLNIDIGYVVCYNNFCFSIVIKIDAGSAKNERQSMVQDL